MAVTPTDKWISSSLVVPDMGAVRRPPEGAPLIVMPAIEAWLIENGFAVREGSSGEAIAPPPTGKTEPDTQLQAVLEFLLSADVDTIAAVRGISNQKAKDLDAARQESPLTIERMQELLTQPQIRAIQGHLQ